MLCNRATVLRASADDKHGVATNENSSLETGDFAPLLGGVGGWVSLRLFRGSLWERVAAGLALSLWLCFLFVWCHDVFVQR